MGAHSPSTTSSTSSTAGRAAAATGLAALGLLSGAGAALAGDASTPTGPPQHATPDSECSVGGLPAGGSGTGSPDGVITNGQCSQDEIEQAQHDAETDGDPTTRAGFDSAPGNETATDDNTDDDTAEGGDPDIVGGTGNGISSQSGTAQKVAPSAHTRSDDPAIEQPEPISSGVL